MAEVEVSSSRLGRRIAVDAVLVLIAAFVTMATRAFGVASPLVDFHSWRQTHTAMVAKNFLSNGYNILNPQVDQFGPKPVFLESEFPLYQYVVALAYSFTGVQDWVARSVSIAFACGGVIVLYLMVRQFAGRSAAFFSCLFFALSPFGIFFGRAVMPESAMIFFTILTFYFALRWRFEAKTSTLFLTVVSAALAISIKLPSAYLVLPIAYLLFKRGERLVSNLTRTCTFLLGALLPPAAWYYYAAKMGQESGASLGLVSTMGGDRLGSLSLWLNPDFYKLLGMWTVDDIITWAGVPFVALGLLIAVASALRSSKPSTTTSHSMPVNTYSMLVLLWALAVILYFLASANGLVNQEYYMLPALPVASVLGGAGLAWVCSRALRMKTPLAWGIVAVFAATSSLSVAVLSFGRALPLYAQVTPFVDTGRAVKASTPEDAVVVAVHHGQPEVIYYAGRHGWQILPAEFSLNRIEILRSQGATVAAIAEAVPLAGSAEMADVLRKYPALAIGPSLLVIDLTKHEGEKKLKNDSSFTFGQSMALLGYEAGLKSDNGRQSVDVLLRWKALRQMPQDYHISLRLFSGQGELVVQADGVPVNWFFPTARWLPGDIVDDPYNLKLPGNTDVKGLRLELVVYDGANLRPLSVDQTNQPNLDLGAVNLEEQ